MPKTHIVQANECLANIAKAYNFRSWQTIYNAPENSELRQQRPNPNVLYPGDKIVIPDLGDKSYPRPTDLEHFFVVQDPKWVLRLRMLDEEGNPIAGEPYKLTPSGAPPVLGSTGTDGMIEQELPAQIRQATLTFLGEQFDVQIGMLDPISRVKGVQGRLNNLGFHAGAVDGIVGSETRRAVYGFQVSQDLQATGDLDEITLKLLLSNHDNDSRYTPPEENMGPQNSPALVAEQQEPGEDPPGDADNAPQTDWSEPEGCHA